MLSLSEPIRKAEIERVAPLEPINTPTRRGPRVNILPDVSAVLTNLKPRFGEVPCNILLCSLQSIALAHALAGEGPRGSWWRQVKLRVLHPPSPLPIVRTGSSGRGARFPFAHPRCLQL